MTIKVFCILEREPFNIVLSKGILSVTDVSSSVYRFNFIMPFQDSFYEIFCQQNTPGETNEGSFLKYVIEKRDNFSIIEIDEEKLNNGSLNFYFK